MHIAGFILSVGGRPFGEVLVLASGNCGSRDHVAFAASAQSPERHLQRGTPGHVLSLLVDEAFGSDFVYKEGGVFRPFWLAVPKLDSDQGESKQRALGLIPPELYTTQGP